MPSVYAIGVCHRCVCVASFNTASFAQIDRWTRLALTDEALFTHKKRRLLKDVLLAFPNFTLSLFLQSRYPYSVLCAWGMVKSIVTAWASCPNAFNQVAIFMDAGHLGKSGFGKGILTRNNGASRLLELSIRLFLGLHIVSCLYVIFMGYVEDKYLPVEFLGGKLPAFGDQNEEVKVQDRDGGDMICVRRGGDWVDEEDEEKVCIDVNADEWFLREWVMSDADERHVSYLYMESFHKVFLLLFGASSDAQNVREQVFNTCFLVLGLIMSATVIGFVSAIFSSFDSVAIAEMEELNSINRFLEFHGVSSDMRFKINEFFECVSERSEARLSEAWQGKARQGKARQGKARQGKARQGKARQGKAKQAEARPARNDRLAMRRPPGLLLLLQLS